MKLKIQAISGITLFLLMVIHPVYASPLVPDVLITELQVRSNATTGAADQEFVELYNTTNQPIDVSSWKLQYKSSTGSTWTDKATLHGNIAAHGHYLLVSDKYPDTPTALPDDPPLALVVFSAGLADSGGHVRLVDLIIPTFPVVHDALGWGSNANAAEGNAPAAAPAGGKSLKRLVNEDATFKDTDNNANDFEVSPSPTPQVDPLFIAPTTDPEPNPTPVSEPIDPTLEPTAEPTQPGSETPNAGTSENEYPDLTSSADLAPPQITELLPNPAAPATDSKDEFIELYNPNDKPLDLKNYKLQSGNNFSYSYVFETEILSAHEYRAFIVTQTGNILANTSGQARLMDPIGNIVGQTNVYDSAPEGESWALINGAWQWTTTPTPNAINIMTVQPPKAVTATKAATKTIASNKTTKSTAAKPPTKAKTAAVKSAKTSSTPERQTYQEPPVVPASLHPMILAGVGAITLLYAGYEYRHDAANTYRRLQRYREIRRAARAGASGR